MDNEKFGRRVCIAVDIESYSKRIESEQAQVQRDLTRMIGAAATRAQLDVGEWLVQEQGDGQLALAPLDDTEPRYVDSFVHQLVIELARNNRTLVPEARLRMRVAIHHGIAYAGANGFVGDAVILVCRLLDSQACRVALTSSLADLVLILSSATYTDNVLAEHTMFEPNDFAAVAIDEAKVTTEAWIWSPDRQAIETLREARLRRAGPAPAKRYEPADHAATVTHIDTIHKIDKAHFGTRVVRGDDDE